MSRVSSKRISPGGPLGKAKGAMSNAGSRPARGPADGVTRMDRDVRETARADKKQS